MKARVRTRQFFLLGKMPHPNSKESHAYDFAPFYVLTLPPEGPRQAARLFPPDPANSLFACEPSIQNTATPALAL